VKEKYRQALPIHLEHVKRHFAAYIEDDEAAAVESALMRMANARPSRKPIMTEGGPSHAK